MDNGGYFIIYILNVILRGANKEMDENEKSFRSFDLAILRETKVRKNEAFPAS